MNRIIKRIFMASLLVLLNACMGEEGYKVQVEPTLPVPILIVPDHGSSNTPNNQVYPNNNQNNSYQQNNQSQPYNTKRQHHNNNGTNNPNQQQYNQPPYDSNQQQDYRY